VEILEWRWERLGGDVEVEGREEGRKGGGVGMRGERERERERTKGVEKLRAEGVRETRRMNRSGY